MTNLNNKTTFWQMSHKHPNMYLFLGRRIQGGLTDIKLLSEKGQLMSVFASGNNWLKETLKVEKFAIF